VVEIEYSLLDNRQIKREKVSVNLENAVIISEKEHIDIIDEIRNIVSEYLTVNKENVVIYG
jgi:hypothetical protein